jgi:Uma2 family endonuclease
MSSAIKILPYYTYEDYCKWEGRWEIIGGIPSAMSPAPSPRHQWVTTNIMIAIGNAIKKSGSKNCKLYNFIDIKVADDIQPDAVVVCKEIKKAFLDFPAALVVEVLSPLTAMKDRNNKFYIYQSKKICYYVIVDIDKNEIEVYHLEENDKYELEKISTGQPYTFILDTGSTPEVVLNNIWE